MNVFIAMNFGLGNLDRKNILESVEKNQELCMILNPENKTMFAVSYSLIFAWHPKLSLPRQTVVRGYNHSLDELSDMTYLTSEQLPMRNQRTLHQLRDVIVDVHLRKRKNAIVEMFNIVLKFACDILMCWFNNKLKKLNLDHEIAINYRRAFPVTSETKCVMRFCIGG